MDPKNDFAMNPEKENRIKPGPKDPEDTFFGSVDVEFLIHELKDPVAVVETGIRAILERREKYGPLTAKQEKTLQRVLRNTRKARRMLYDLLEVGRSEADAFSACRFSPFTAAVQTAADTLEVFMGADIELPGKDLPPIELFETFSRFGVHFSMAEGFNRLTMDQDDTKVRQILGNLMKNALHHRKSRIDVALYANGDHVVIDVADDGPGVAPEHRQIIFERYRQADTACQLVQRKGHGLGLAASRILARRLGGRHPHPRNPGQRGCLPPDPPPFHCSRGGAHRVITARTAPRRRYIEPRKNHPQGKTHPRRG